jgi:iron complex outermembrane receptor protein
MPDGQTTLNHVELGTLGRAEVARGPASAVYGNAAGGVIALASEPPPAGPFSASTRLVGGSDGLARLQASAGGVGAGVDWSVTGARLQYDGFREFSDQRSTRVTGQAGVGDAARGAGRLRATAAWVDYDARNPGSLPDSLRARAPRRAWPNNVTQQTGEAGRHGQLGLSYQRQTGAGTVDASAYTLRRDLDNPIPPTVIALGRAATGARLAYSGGVSAGALAVRATVGGELQRQRDDRRNWANARGVRGALTLDQLERVTNAAAFAQADATVGGRVTLLAGLRRDRITFAADDRLVTAANPDDSGERTMAATSPSVGLSVAVGPRLRVFANAATAFETPTTTELANRPTGAGGFNPELDPQRTRSAEVGLNGGFTLGARVAGTVQVAAYDARVTDALIPFEVPAAAGRQFYRNAGRLRHRGVETSASLAVGARALARVAYTHVDATFREYAVRGTSFAGNRLPGVAPHRLDLSFELREPGGAFVVLEERAQSWTPADDANRARSPGYLVSGLRGGWRVLRLGGAELSPFAGVTNLFDVRHDAAVTVNAAGARYYEPAPGRLVYLGADAAIGRRR